MVKISEDEELPRVLAEIAESMDAQAALLSMHPDGNIAAEAVSATSHDILSPAHLQPMFESADVWPLGGDEDDFRWSSQKVEGHCFDVLALPVQRIRGHSQAVVTVWFEGRSPEQLQKAEQVYLRRRPFAVGYFRLWQMDRARKLRLSALESALNLADFGVILIERSGEVTFCNRLASELLDNQDGIRLSGARVSTNDLKSSVTLRVAIDHVIATGNEEDAVYPLIQLARPSGPPLIAAVLPVEEPAQELSHVAAVLYLVDPDVSLERSLPPICKLYRLSNVETQLAVKLATGHSLAEAARMLRVQEQTARTYLKTIFLKMDVHRQADMIRLLLGSLIRVPYQVQAVTQIDMV